jgi:CRISPR-associated protein Csh1
MLNSIYNLGKWYQKNNDTLKLLVTDPCPKNNGIVIEILIMGGEYKGLCLRDYTPDLETKLLYKKLNGHEDASLTSKLQTNKVQNTIKRIFNHLSKNDPELYDKLKDYKEKIVRDLERLEYDKKKVYLLTIKLDGKLPGEVDKYVEGFKKRISRDFYMDSNVKARGVGVCSLCNEEKEVNGLFRELKWYTIHNSSFSMFEDKNEAYKQFPVCDDCAYTLIAGKRVLDDLLTIKLFGMDAWVIPKTSRIEDLDKFMSMFISFIKGYEKLGFTRDFTMLEQRLERFLSSQKQVLSYSIVFWIKGHDWKIIDVIDEVPPSRFTQIIKRIREVEKEFEHEEVNFSKKPKKERLNFLKKVYKIVDDKHAKGFKFRWGYAKDWFGSPNEKISNSYIPIVKLVYAGNEIPYARIRRVQLKKLQSEFIKNERISIESVNKIKIFNKVIGDNMEITKEVEFITKIARMVKIAAWCQREHVGGQPIMRSLYDLDINAERLLKIYTKAYSVVLKYRQADKVGYGANLEKEIVELSKVVNLDGLSKSEISFWFAIGLGSRSNNEEEINVIGESNRITQ